MMGFENRPGLEKNTFSFTTIQFTIKCFVSSLGIWISSGNYSLDLSTPLCNMNLNRAKTYDLPNSNLLYFSWKMEEC